MRELSQFERDLVKKLCDDTRDIGGLLNDYLDRVIIEIDRDTDQITLKFNVPPEADNTSSKYVIERACIQSS